MIHDEEDVGRDCAPDMGDDTVHGDADQGLPGLPDLAIAEDVPNEPKKAISATTQEMIEILENLRYDSGIRTSATPIIAICDAGSYGYKSMAMLPEIETIVFTGRRLRLRLSPEQLSIIATGVDDEINEFFSQATAEEIEQHRIVALCIAGDGFFMEYDHVKKLWVEKPIPKVLHI